MNLTGITELSIGGIALKELRIDGVSIWRKTTEEQKNLVESAIDTNKTVFNGTGYKDGYRVSSSGTLKELSGYTSTGFMPCVSGDTIEFEDVDFSTAGSGNTMSFYDEDFNILGLFTTQPAGYHLFSDDQSVNKTVTKTGDIYSYQVPTTANIADVQTKLNNIRYFRISASGSGANLFVTVKSEQHD